MLRQIGTKARIEMERFFAAKIFLELFVRVQKDWTTDPGCFGNSDTGTGPEGGSSGGPLDLSVQDLPDFRTASGAGTVSG
jgi:hypothetical protein